MQPKFIQRKNVKFCQMKQISINIYNIDRADAEN